MGGVISRRAISVDPGEEIAADLLAKLQVAAKQPLNLEQFQQLLTQEGISFPGNSEALQRECFRLLDKNENGLIEESEAHRALAELGPGSGASILKLVPAGEGATADATFVDGKYDVEVLGEDTCLYRVGVAGQPLGQFFSAHKFVSAAEVRSGCAVKDDWDVAGVSWREVFRPRIDTLYTFTVPKDTVLYKGRAAPLEKFMQVDSLAARVFKGGQEQVMIVRPWQIGGKDWKHTAAPLQGGACWEVLGYEPTAACRAALEHDAQALSHLGKEDAEAPSEGLGLTPMHHAAIGGHRAAALAVVAAGADPDVSNHMGLTPLMLACICGHVDMAAFLLSLEAVDPNAAEVQHGRTSLHIAAAEGLESAVSAFLAHAGTDASVQAKDRTTPLWAAASHGQAGVIPLLAAARGVNVDAGGKLGLSPLLCAVVRGHADAARALLRAKASVNRLPDGSSMLELAIARQSEDLLRALLSQEASDAGLNPSDIIPHFGCSALAVAVRKSAVGLVRTLFECELPSTHLRTDEQDEDGDGLLHVASRRGDAEMTTVLAHKIDPNAKNSGGSSPLFIASALGHVAAVEALCRVRGINLDLADRDGWTPLHVAANKVSFFFSLAIKVCLRTHAKSLVNKGHVGVARVLVAAGANKKIANHGAIPADMAKTDEVRVVVQPEEGYTKPKLKPAKPKPKPKPAPKPKPKPK